MLWCYHVFVVACAMLPLRGSHGLSVQYLLNLHFLFAKQMSHLECADISEMIMLPNSIRQIEISLQIFLSLSRVLILIGNEG